MAENENMLTVKEQQALETVLEGYQKTKVAYKALLSANPPKEVVRHHKFGDFDYLPITAVERLLDGLFDGWTPTIKEVGTAVNGFYVVLNLKAKIPQTDQYMEADGIGFAEFNTKQGKSPMDFMSLQQAAGVTAVPKARAEAIKNAAKSFGNLFGRNLNRNDDQSEQEKELVNTGRTKIANTLKAVEDAEN